VVLVCFFVICRNTILSRGAQTDARGAKQVLDRGGQAVARGSVIDRGAQAVARGAVPSVVDTSS
jgi:hypothetical protein